MKKHKISFEDAIYVFSDKNAIIMKDEEHSNYEDRFITMVNINRKFIVVVVVVHTYRIKNSNEEVIRIISARYATKNEINKYYNRGNYE
ncbi:BrnT family toxin [Brachyspira hampsonii]|uniref:BrnT family toxin n=1 Tax=Brachyspira hampsonii TaxID=1287055 RepID=UPI001C402EC4